MWESFGPGLTGIPGLEKPRERLGVSRYKNIWAMDLAEAGIKRRFAAARRKRRKLLEIASGIHGWGHEWERAACGKEKRNR